jgi:hypothetical protein
MTGLRELLYGADDPCDRDSHRPRTTKATKKINITSVKYP